MHGIAAGEKGSPVPVPCSHEAEKQTGPARQVLWAAGPREAERSVQKLQVIVRHLASAVVVGLDRRVLEEVSGARSPQLLALTQCPLGKASLKLSELLGTK